MNYANSEVYVVIIQFEYDLTNIFKFGHVNKIKEYTLEDRYQHKSLWMRFNNEHFSSLM